MENFENLIGSQSGSKKMGRLLCELVSDYSHSPCNICDRKKARDILIYETEHPVVIEKVAEALAILGPQLYLEISNLSQQASELVSDHMRILCYVCEAWEISQPRLIRTGVCS